MRRLKDYKATEDGVKIREPDHRILSLGGGQQSTALAVMAYLEKYPIPKPDKIIYASAGAEPKTKKYVKNRAFPWLRKRGANCQIVNCGDILEHTKQAAKERNIVILPVWAKAENEDGYFPLPQMCSYVIKIRAITKALKKAAGLEPNEHASGNILIETWLGISQDEQERRRPPRQTWQTYRYPLIENELNREDCIKVFDEINLPTPERSSCYFCPFQQPEKWLELKNERPKLWRKAVQLDELIREKAGIEQNVYLHSQGKPLKDTKT